MLILKSLGIWFLLALLAILNGTLRVKLITPNFGEYIGHVISSVILILIIFIVAYFFINNLKITSYKNLWTIGIFWFSFTIIFEFLFGHYVMDHPWSKLLADYNILRGRVWSFVLLANLFAPIICGKLFIEN